MLKIGGEEQVGAIGAWVLSGRRGRWQRRTSLSSQGNLKQGTKELESFRKLRHFPLLLILMPSLTSQAVRLHFGISRNNRRTEGACVFILRQVGGSGFLGTLFLLAGI